MTKTPRVWIAIVVALTAWASIAHAQTKLVVGNAGGSSADAERKVFYGPFAAANKIQVQEESFNQELAKIRSQVETGNLIWDMVSTTAINVATGCEEGLLEKIDWAKYLDPKAFQDVGGISQCGVPYLFVSGGLTYDGNRIKEGPKTWAGRSGAVTAPRTSRISGAASRRWPTRIPGRACRAGARPCPCASRGGWPSPVP